MRELVLHLLDIAENSIAANARTIQITVAEDLVQDQLWMRVTDDGKGMSPEMLARVIDPFVTSRTTRKVGLGIPLLKAAAEACNGGLTIQSELGRGTQVDVTFQHSHIDRNPLGDLPGTWLTLLIGAPHVHWILTYRYNGAEFQFDDAPVKETLGEVPLTEPSVLAYVREMLETGIQDVRSPQTA